MKKTYDNTTALQFIKSELKKRPDLTIFKNSIGTHLEMLMEELDSFRICSSCGKPMVEGYCIEDGEAYYCSDECLHKNICPKDYIAMYNNGKGHSYWTNWWEYAN